MNNKEYIELILQDMPYVYVVDDGFDTRLKTDGDLEHWFYHNQDLIREALQQLKEKHDKINPVQLPYAEFE